MDIRPASRKVVFALFIKECGGPDSIMPALFDPDRLTQCDELFAVEVDGAIAGVVGLASGGCDGSRGPTLATLYTVEAHRGRGIGRTLCEFAIRHFVEAGRTPILCDVTTRGMHRTIDRLPADLQVHLKARLSYQVYGDEWDD